MTQIYSNPKRESEPFALPDVEVFYQSYIICNCGDMDFQRGTDDPCSNCNSPLNDTDTIGVGFFYWYCLPGCLPDGDPVGPFESEQAAIDDAQADAWQYDDEMDS